MKPFQNPYFVGVTALVAVALVLWNLKPAAQPIVTAAVKTGPARVPEPKLFKLSTTMGPDKSGRPEIVTAIEPTLPAGAEWVEAPRRDPFRLPPAPDAAPPVPQTPEVIPVLSAVWLQTGDRLALLNGRMVREGETIDGFVVVQIEHDHVYLRGPRGVSCLKFGQLSRTNAPAPGLKPLDPLPPK